MIPLQQSGLLVYFEDADNETNLVWLENFAWDEVKTIKKAFKENYNKI